MHEIARHTIHSTETIEMAMETVATMTSEHDHFAKSHQSAEDGRSPLSSFERTRKALTLQRTLLKCLHLRSRALDERLRNEINLVSFLLGHRLPQKINRRLEFPAKKKKKLKQLIWLKKKGFQLGRSA